jgi:hypothetical protein
MTGTVDVAGVQRWYASYLDDFGALARGDRDDAPLLLDHYAVPLLIVTDGATTVLADEQQVVAHVQAQLQDLRPLGYDRSELLDSDTAVLNSRCATHRARVRRVRGDGTEIVQLEATYLVTRGPQGHRISVIVVHST